MLRSCLTVANCQIAPPNMFTYILTHHFNSCCLINPDKLVLHDFQSIYYQHTHNCLYCMSMHGLNFTDSPYSSITFLAVRSERRICWCWSMRSAAEAGGEDALMCLQTSCVSSVNGGRPLSCRRAFFKAWISSRPPRETYRHNTDIQTKTY